MNCPVTQALVRILPVALIAEVDTTPEKTGLFLVE
jgi:hypothetical protein